MSDPVMAALAGAIADMVPYVLFIALAERVVGILRRAFMGKEAYF